MSEIIRVPKSLNNNTVSSYYFLAETQNRIIDSFDDSIILDFSNCIFSHAVFTSFIGALTHIGKAFGKTITYRTKKIVP